MAEQAAAADGDPSPESRPCTLGLFLLPGFNSLALHAFADPFRAANYLVGTTLYEWHYLTPDTHRVIASNGLEIAGAQPFDALNVELDFLVINASWAPEQSRVPRLQNWLRRLARMGTVMCGIDTGAFVLAYAGLMTGYKAAVHYEHIAAFRELFPECGMDEDMFVFDRDRLTCCGGLAAADMALEIIRLQQGIDLANAASRYIFHERLRSGSEGQLPSTREPVGHAAPERLRDAIILMERNLEQPLRLPEIAETLGISQRQLERLFQKYTGASPVRYYVDVRLDRARGLITQTELPIVDVATGCGFGGAVQFARAYKQRFGIAPSVDRTEGRVPFQFRSFPSHAGVGAQDQKP